MKTKEVFTLPGIEEAIPMSVLQTDDKGVLTTCRACSQKNRLAFEHLGQPGRCGRCKSDIPAPSMPIEISGEAAFDTAIRLSPLPVVVDFWAPWCGPCQTVAPELEKVAAASSGNFVVCKVNTEALPDLGQRFSIRSIPTMAVFVGGREVARSAGARPAPEIEAFVHQSLTKQTT